MIRFIVCIALLDVLRAEGKFPPGQISPILLIVTEELVVVQFFRAEEMNSNIISKE